MQREQKLGMGTGQKRGTELKTEVNTCEGATGRTQAGGEDPIRNQDPQKTVRQWEQAKRHQEPRRPSRISSLLGILIWGGWE